MSASTDTSSRNTTASTTKQLGQNIASNIAAHLKTDLRDKYQTTPTQTIKRDLRHQQITRCNERTDWHGFNAAVLHGASVVGGRSDGPTWGRLQMNSAVVVRARTGGHRYP